MQVMEHQYVTMMVVSLGKCFWFKVTRVRERSIAVAAMSASASVKVIEVVTIPCLYPSTERTDSVPRDAVIYNKIDECY